VRGAAAMSLVQDYTNDKSSSSASASSFEARERPVSPILQPGANTNLECKAGKRPLPERSESPPLEIMEFPPPPSFAPTCFASAPTCFDHLEVEPAVSASASKDGASSPRRPRKRPMLKNNLFKISSDMVPPQVRRAGTANVSTEDFDSVDKKARKARP
jgi:hypothetical protein